MAIYGRFGCEVTLTRRATAEDAAEECRKAGAGARPWEPESLVWVRFAEDGPNGAERLYALPYLRADGGSLEITDAVRALPEVS